MTDTLANAAADRFFIRVEQVGTATERDERTRPLLPLLLVMDAEMLEADARYEAARGESLK